MAAGKLTPRQKMINMMYLVLTALLALNVSKEVLQSFFDVNKGIERTTSSFDLKNQENSGNSQKFLCKVKKSINFKDQLIYVGDEVAIEKIDFKSKRAIITSLKKRKNLLVRPSVANISNIYVTFSVEEPCLLYTSPSPRDS